MKQFAEALEDGCSLQLQWKDFVFETNSKKRNARTEERVKVANKVKEIDRNIDEEKMRLNEIENWLEERN